MVALNGRRISVEPFSHPHGREGDLFLLLGEPVHTGDDITLDEDVPASVRDVWVRFTLLDGKAGNWNIRMVRDGRPLY